MKVKNIVSEDFSNYKVPSMFIVSAVCDWKCCKEQNLDIGVCQNAPLVSHPTHEIRNTAIYEAYRNNSITGAIVIGGLEPMLQIDEVLDLIFFFRTSGCLDPFIIYTGYDPGEIVDKLARLREYGNIIVKFGRYIPDRPSRFDEALGVYLASDNQHAERIS